MTTWLLSIAAVSAIQHSQDGIDHVGAVVLRDLGAFHVHRAVVPALPRQCANQHTQTESLEQKYAASLRWLSDSSGSYAHTRRGKQYKRRQGETQDE